VYGKVLMCFCQLRESKTICNRVFVRCWVLDAGESSDYNKV